MPPQQLQSTSASTPQTSPAKLLSPEFLALCVVSFLAFCNIAIFYGFYSYLREIGIAAAWRGPLLALEPLTAFALRPFLSQRLTLANGVRYMRLGAILAIGALLSYPLVHEVWSIACVRVLHGAGYVILASALMVTFTHFLPRDRVAQGFGLFSLTILLPYTIMPPFIEAVTPLLPGPGVAYAVAAPLMLVVLVLLRPLERRAQALAEKLPNGHLERPSWAEVFRNLGAPGIGRLILGNFGMVSGHIVIFYFMKDWALSLGAANPGMFFTCSNIATMGLRLLAAQHMDGLNSGRTLALALFFMALVAPLFSLAPGPAGLYALAGCYGLGIGLCMPLFNAAMYTVSPPQLRGVNTNLLLVALDAGFFTGPLLGGALLTLDFGLSGLFWVCGAIFFCTGLVIWPVRRLTEKQMG